MNARWCRHSRTKPKTSSGSWSSSEAISQRCKIGHCTEDICGKNQQGQCLQERQPAGIYRSHVGRKRAQRRGGLRFDEGVFGISLRFDHIDRSAPGEINLEAVAKQYGLQPEDLDKAIRAWGAKTTDPYDAGLAALYERNYDKATTDLQTSLSKREEKLASDQNAVAVDRKRWPTLRSFWVPRSTSKATYKESAWHISAACKSGPMIRPF